MTSSPNAFDSFLEALRTRLGGPLPGAGAQRRMEPELSFGRHTHEPPLDARQAAVTMLMYPRGEEYVLPLVVRPEGLADHAGQIGLPGGRVEAGESSEAAALRELEEELGVKAEGLSVIGPLSPIYLFVSNFAVTPWVVACREPPELRPSPREVSEVLELPLVWLSETANISTFRYRNRGIEFIAPCLLWHGHPIWGATAIMLSELAAVLMWRQPIGWNSTHR